MAKTTIRNMRLDDRHWQALEAYARMCGLTTRTGDGDRTAAILKLMDERIPSKCWPIESELEGQLTLV